MSNITNVTWVDPSLYDEGEKAVLGLVPLLVLFIAYLMYKRIKRPPNGSDDSTANRLSIFYNLAAGIIWGQFFFHSLPNATTYGEFGYRLRSVFFLLGYGVMLGYDRFARTSHSNRNFVGRSGTSRGTEYTLKRDTSPMGPMGVGMDADYVRMEGNENPSVLWESTEEYADLGSRRFIAYVYYVVLIFNALCDGLFLTFNSSEMSHPVMIAVFAVDKMMECVALFTVLMHARMYTRRGCSGTAFYVMLVGWPVVVFCSIILVLCGVTADQTSLWINHLALGVFYSIFSGILLWYANHFQHMELEKPTRRELRVSFLLFVLMAFMSWITGYFV